MGIRHISMSIEGLERDIASKTGIEARIFCYECFGMSASDVGNALSSMKAEGMLYIPSEGCPNVNPDGSCGCGKEENSKKS